jgi:hypothetical protein
MRKERDRDSDIGKREMYWEKEKDALGNQNVKYLGTKFEWYNANNFGTEGVLNLHLFCTSSILNCSSLWPFPESNISSFDQVFRKNIVAFYKLK